MFLHRDFFLPFSFADVTFVALRSSYSKTIRMTISKIQLFISVLLFSVGLQAQVFSGKVLDAKTAETLPFVSIGIPGKSVGTVAQLDGSFNITISDIYNNDSIRFSIIGYEAKKMLVSEFKALATAQKAVIKLQPQDEILSEVMIRPRDMKSKILGNEFDSPSITAGFTSDDLGSEIGTVMKLKDGKDYYLKNCGFNFERVDYDSIIFRINIYNIKNGLPGDLLHQLPIYITVYRDQRSAEVDLRPYNLHIDQDFILSLEWVQDLPEKTKSLMFCAGFFGNKVVYRQVAEDVWRDFPIGIGMWCDAEYEKH